MATFSARLADHKVTSQILREVKYEPDPKKRIAYYTGVSGAGTSKFIKSAVDYIVRWKALAELLKAQGEVAGSAFLKVNANIAKAPNRKEAKALVPKLKKSLEERLGLELAASQARTEKLEIEAADIHGAGPQ